MKLKLLQDRCAQVKAEPLLIVAVNIQCTTTCFAVQRYIAQWIMRLINASSLQLEPFNEIETRPSYSIVSHRLVEDEEVTFSDTQLPR